MRVNEKLGVPEGINQEANRLYRKLLRDIDDLSLYTFTELDENESEYLITIGTYNINIQDLKLKSVPFDLKLIYHSEVDKPTMVSASYSTNLRYSDKNDKILIVPNIDDSALSITIAVGDGDSQNLNDIINTIKNELTSKTIAHELMHMYDEHKKKIGSIVSKSEYNSFQNIASFPKLISDFLYLLYYTSSNENTVRPTEIYHDMLEKEITKSDFVNYMKDNDIITKLSNAEKFSMKEFKDKLNNDKEVIETVDKMSNNGYDRIGSYADDILNLLMINLINENIDTVRNILKNYIDRSTSPFDMLFSSFMGTSSEDNEKADSFFKKIVKSYMKYKNNHDKYFDILEKRLNFAGKKMKRKLYKLYDMLDTDKKKTGDIFNWELHTKINSKNKKNESFILDFKSFKFNDK